LRVLSLLALGNLRLDQIGPEVQQARPYFAKSGAEDATRSNIHKLKFGSGKRPVAPPSGFRAPLFPENAFGRSHESHGTVDVHWTDSTRSTITFTSNTVGGNIYLFGDGGTAGVNVNATSSTLSNITGSNAGTGITSGGPFTDGGAGNLDGFGSFNQTINTFDGSTHSSDTVSFTLTNTSGTWADSASVLTANAWGEFVAAHIFVTASPANASNGALATGFASTGTTTSTPEPASLILLVSGLIGIPFFRRQK
jgi:hypothetical protein